MFSLDFFGEIFSFAMNELALHSRMSRSNLTYWEKLEGFVCANIFFKNADNLSACQNSAWMAPILTALAVPVRLGVFYERLAVPFVSLLPFMSALSLWSCSKLFSNYLLSQSVQSSELYRMLHSLKQLSNLISKAVGSLVTITTEVSSLKS